MGYARPSLRFTQPLASKPKGPTSGPRCRARVSSEAAPAHLLLLRSCCRGPRLATCPRVSALHAFLPHADTFSGEAAEGQPEPENYGEARVADLFLQRGGWQAFFCIGLILAANVVQEFDTLIAEHVELSFFVPLIIGHGGNSGAQTSSAIARALALKQVCPKSAAAVIKKEASAGCMMGAALGTSVFFITLATGCCSPQVSLVVAISLPAISLWANTLGAALTLSSAKLHLDPCLTSAPLVTTIIDTTGLIMYFTIAEAVMSQSALLPAIVSQNAVMAVL